MSQENRPYQQLTIANTIQRQFKQDVLESELVWHRDERDRQVTVVGQSDWMFQFDNQLPFTLKEVLFIPKDTYHRLIKGTGILNVQIQEY